MFERFVFVFDNFDRLVHQKLFPETSTVMQFQRIWLLVAGLVIIPITLLVDIGMYSGALNFEEGTVGGHAFGINLANITDYYNNFTLDSVMNL